MLTHESVLSRAIKLAKLGFGQVSPNPMVGAIILYNDKIIGEGYHQKYGKAHAEVNAINQVFKNYPKQASQLLKEATIYVTLEPCAHYGKTPPCADLIIKHQIPNVVIGCLDPFEGVNGKGIEKLKAAGIQVISGILEKECLALNERFFTRVLKQRPYIILKWAQTENHYFSPTNGTKKWITSPESKRLVHLWRSQEDCVLVGKNTALADDPQLNVRLVKGKNPKRAVIDQKLSLPKNLNIFNNEVKTFIFNDVLTDIDDQTLYISIEDFEHFLPQYILFQLYLQDIQSVIIEGGVKTLQTFIDAGLWDEARVFTAPIIWEDGLKAPQLKGVINSQQKIGSDQLSIIKPI